MRDDRTQRVNNKIIIYNQFSGKVYFGRKGKRKHNKILPCCNDIWSFWYQENTCQSNREIYAAQCGKPSIFFGKSMPLFILLNLFQELLLD